MTFFWIIWVVLAVIAIVPTAEQRQIARLADSIWQEADAAEERQRKNLDAILAYVKANRAEILASLYLRGVAEIPYPDGTIRILSK